MFKTTLAGLILITATFTAPGANAQSYMPYKDAQPQVSIPAKSKGAPRANHDGRYYDGRGPVNGFHRDGGHGGRRHGGGDWHNGWGGDYGRMGPRQVRRSLRHRGFHRIRIVRPKRNVYIVKAIGWRGFPVRMVVDAYTGQILKLRPARGGVHWSGTW